MSRSGSWRIFRYADSTGFEPFTQWLLRQDPTIQSRIRNYVARLESGSLSSMKWLGGNLGELRVDVGPGYRIYLTRYGHDVLVLLLGGDKGSQKRDIEQARSFVRALKGTT